MKSTVPEPGLRGNTDLPSLSMYLNVSINTVFVKKKVTIKMKLPFVIKFKNYWRWIFQSNVIAYRPIIV